MNDIFRAADKQNKGHLGIIDLEDILSQHSEARSNGLMKDANLLLLKYDRSGNRRITYLEFIDELTPK